MRNNNLLSDFLAASVPLRIMEIQQACESGPTQEQWDSIRGLPEVLGEKGDVLLFGSKKKGEAAEIANQLAQAIAVMAFLPGGVKIFGQHFCATVPEKEKVG